MAAVAFILSVLATVSAAVNRRDSMPRCPDLVGDCRSDEWVRQRCPETCATGTRERPAGAIATRRLTFRRGDAGPELVVNKGERIDDAGNAWCATHAPKDFTACWGEAVPRLLFLNADPARMTLNDVRYPRDGVGREVSDSSSKQPFDRAFARTFDRTFEHTFHRKFDRTFDRSLLR